jgi:hypothetical protein
VANNLNDISKDHPERVLDVCEKWAGKSPRTDRVVKHACRTLLKAGNPRAMHLFGFGDPKRTAVTGLATRKKRLKIGGSVAFEFTLDVKTKKPCDVRLEYAVTFARANDKTSRKVFQVSEKTYAPGRHRVARKHNFADMSTRKHFPGPHTITIIVNGVEKAATEVQLTR